MLNTRNTLIKKGVFNNSRRFFGIMEEKKGGSKKLWGGRFEKDVSQSILRWTESITVDSH